MAHERGVGLWAVAIVGSSGSIGKSGLGGNRSSRHERSAGDWREAHARGGSGECDRNGMKMNGPLPTPFL